jgi:hypothetical protein
MFEELEVMWNESLVAKEAYEKLIQNSLPRAKIRTRNTPNTK